MNLNICLCCGQPASGHPGEYPCPPESFQYEPLWDFVVVRSVHVDTTNGVVLPESTMESVAWFVVAVSADTKGLAPGDQVLVIGTQGQDVVRLPRERNLYVTKEKNLILKVLR